AICHHAFALASLAHVDRSDTGMPARAAQHSHVHPTRHRDVCRPPRFAADQLSIYLAWYGGSDSRLRCFRHAANLLRLEGSRSTFDTAPIRRRPRRIVTSSHCYHYAYSARPIPPTTPRAT